MIEDLPLHVLLVEDSLTDARLMLDTFSELPAKKFLVEHVDLLSQAVAHLKQHRVDVILLDSSLPDAQGLDIVRQIAAIAPDLPMLILTGLEDNAMAIKAVQSGAQDYLIKGQIDGQLLMRSMRYAIERKRLEREHHELLTRQQDASAEAAIHARDQILAVVAHDLRNPLNTITMSATLLHDCLLPEAFRNRQLEVISRSVDRMDSLIQDLLDIAKIEAGHLSIRPKPILAEALVAEALDFHQSLASGRSIRLESQVQEALPSLPVDRNRIQQVFSNLIGNAVKFTPEGGQITVQARFHQEDVQFSVTDTGSGMLQEHLAHVFDPFWQAQSNGRAGSGLGLAIVKGIVEAHGGRIWVESTFGSGSSFHFTLPPGGRHHAP